MNNKVVFEVARKIKSSSYLRDAYDSKVFGVCEKGSMEKLKVYNESQSRFLSRNEDGRHEANFHLQYTTCWTELPMVTGSFSFHYLFEESQVEFGVGHTYMILVIANDCRGLIHW